MITALIFIAVIGVLVVVHEFGHFIVAKRSGMKVEEFGFGFPPRLFGIKKGETTYSINWIPFGGFVKIYGEDGEHRDAPRSFSSKPIGTRLKVIVAGVKIFDEIVGFSTAQEVRDYISANAGRKIELTIRSDSQTEVKEISLPEKDEGDGLLGIVPARTGLLSYPWYESLWRGLQDAVFLTAPTAVGYYELFRTLLLRGQLLADVSGPIGIANITGQAAAVGFRFLLQFVALISVNLAILNIIPFPALDGGRALMLVVEKFKRSPVNQKIESAINSVGFAFLILLMIYATVKDISRIF